MFDLWNEHKKVRRNNTFMALTVELCDDVSTHGTRKESHCRGEWKHVEYTESRVRSTSSVWDDRTRLRTWHITLSLVFWLLFPQTDGWVWPFLSKSSRPLYHQLSLTHILNQLLCWLCLHIGRLLTFLQRVWPNRWVCVVCCHLTIRPHTTLSPAGQNLVPKEKTWDKPLFVPLCLKENRRVLSLQQRKRFMLVSYTLLLLYVFMFVLLLFNAFRLFFSSLQCGAIMTLI